MKLTSNQLSKLTAIPGKAGIGLKVVKPKKPSAMLNRLTRRFGIKKV